MYRTSLNEWHSDFSADGKKILHFDVLTAGIQKVMSILMGQFLYFPIVAIQGL
jgi:hypothetical protein